MTDKKKGVPKGNKVPIIGESEIQKAIKELVQYLDPIILNFSNMFDAIDKRLAVVEEVKKIFPDKVEVTVKHEYPKTALPLRNIEGVKLGKKELPKDEKNDNTKRIK